MKKKEWWYYLLVAVLFILLLPILCLYGIYRFFINYKNSGYKRWIVGMVSLAILALFSGMMEVKAFTGNNDNSNNVASVATTSKPKHSTSKISSTSKESSSSSKISETSSSSKKVVATETTNTSSILAKLISYTNAKSPGPTKNYYWDNGNAIISGFENMKAGDYHFSEDNQGRSGTARAVLTYSEYQNSKGSRQGEPLDPPSWPASNPMVAITFSLTGRTYHGYFYNRSHSIADSLLGQYSYTSQFNFTTGTRSQNVGADQNGGMRAAEELAENYWYNHPNTSTTIQYETTPLYNGNETIPRGSIVDEKSSDGVVNAEIVVINDAEGVTINYNSGSEASSTPTTTTVAATTQSKPTTSSAQTAAPTSNTSANTANGWTTAASGMVFVKLDSGKYYSSVVNPQNYQYMSQTSANSQGYTRALRGNEYARP